MAWRCTGDKPLPEPVLTQFTDAWNVALDELKQWYFHSCDTLRPEQINWGFADNIFNTFCWMKNIVFHTYSSKAITWINDHHVVGHHIASLGNTELTHVNLCCIGITWKKKNLSFRWWHIHAVPILPFLIELHGETNKTISGHDELTMICIHVYHLTQSHTHCVGEVNSMIPVFNFVIWCDN